MKTNKDLRQNFDDIVLNIAQLSNEIEYTDLDVESLTLLNNAIELVKFVRNDYYNKQIEQNLRYGGC